MKGGWGKDLGRRWGWTAFGGVCLDSFFDETG